MITSFLLRPGSPLQNPPKCSLCGFSSGQVLYTSCSTARRLGRSVAPGTAENPTGSHVWQAEFKLRRLTEKGENRTTATCRNSEACCSLETKLPFSRLPSSYIRKRCGGHDDLDGPALHARAHTLQRASLLFAAVLKAGQHESFLTTPPLSTLIWSLRRKTSGHRHISWHARQAHRPSPASQAAHTSSRCPSRWQERGTLLPSPYSRSPRAPSTQARNS